MRSIPLLLDLAEALRLALETPAGPSLAHFRSGLAQAGPLNDLDEPSLKLLYRLWPLAMRSGPDFLRALLDAKPPLDKAPSGHRHLTPLGHAFDHSILYGSSEAGSLLLQAGVSPNCPRVLGEEPCLAHALTASPAEFAVALIHAGADLSWSHPVSGASYLHYAVAHNNPDAVSALLSRGADPKARDVKNRAPMDLATAFNRHECARVINSFLEAQELRSELLPAAAASPRSIAL